MGECQVSVSFCLPDGGGWSDRARSGGRWEEILEAKGEGLAEIKAGFQDDSEQGEVAEADEGLAVEGGQQAFQLRITQRGYAQKILRSGGLYLLQRVGPSQGQAAAGRAGPGLVAGKAVELADWAAGASFGEVGLAGQALLQPAGSIGRAHLPGQLAAEAQQTSHGLAVFAPGEGGLADEPGMGAWSMRKTLITGQGQTVMGGRGFRMLLLSVAFRRGRGRQIITFHLGVHDDNLVKEGTLEAFDHTRKVDQHAFVDLDRSLERDALQGDSA